jgi:hypothetical protein
VLQKKVRLSLAVFVTKDGVLPFFHKDVICFLSISHFTEGPSSDFFLRIAFCSLSAAKPSGLAKCALSVLNVVCREVALRPVAEQTMQTLHIWHPAVEG